MNPNPSVNINRARRVASFLCAASLCGLFATSALAQHTFHKAYPARPNVRLQLENLAGSVRVEVWRHEKIDVRAEMEKRARLEPVVSDGALVINVLRDNGGMRGDMGTINFVIRVPVNSSVDLKTKTGDIRVSGVQGNFVRADVTLDGDIELVDINVGNVHASNTMGNIFFGGALHSSGNYFFSSRQGDINIRVPAESRFSLMASSPVARRIELGSFARFFRTSGGDRRLQGDVAGGGAMLTIVNTHGTISFR